MPKSKVRAKAKKKAVTARTQKQADTNACRDTCCPPGPQNPQPRPRA